MFKEEQAFGCFEYEQMSHGFCHSQPLTSSFATHTERLRFASEQTLTAKNGKCVVAETSTLTADFLTMKIIAATGPNSLNVKCAIPSQNYSLFGAALADRKLQNCLITVGA